MAIIGVLFSPKILTLMDTPENVIKDSLIYLEIYFAGSLFSVMYNIFVGVLQAIGDSKHTLFYLVISSVIDLVLDIIFIALFNTGVVSTALATVISQIISETLCFIQLIRTYECYRLQIRKIKFHKYILNSILKIGLPSGIQNSIISFANVIVQSNINTFGEMAMAEYGAYTNDFLPINSFTLALTTFIGQNIVAKQYDRAKNGAKFGILFTVILPELIGTIIFIFAPQMISAFDSTPEVVKFVIEKSRTASLFYFLLAYSHYISAIFRGVGKAIIPMIIMIFFWYIVHVCFLSITVPITNSIQMVYWVYPLTWGLSSIIFLL